MSRDSEPPRPVPVDSKLVNERIYLTNGEPDALKGRIWDACHAVKNARFTNGLGSLRSKNQLVHRKASSLFGSCSALDGEIGLPRRVHASLC